MASRTPTIHGLRTRALILRPDRPVETASGVLSSTPLVLIDITTAEGIVGSTYVRCYAPVALRPLRDLIDGLGTLLVGQRASPFHIGQFLQKHFRLLGPQGLAGMAMAGIDMAVWDALARACGLPLVSLLGGEPGSIPAYAGLRRMSPEGAAEDAQAAVADGFSAVKVKLGTADLSLDLNVISAIRCAVGPNVRLMIDYNQCLSVAEAIERSKRLDEEGLTWIEEPTRADDYLGHAKISREIRTPIQLGENGWGPNDVAKQIEAQASDHLMLDAMKIGGVSGWLQGAALASAAGLPVSSHTFPEVSAHLLGVSRSAAWLEYVDHVGPILARPVQCKDGYVVVSDQPGSGIEWDEAAITKLQA